MLARFDPSELVRIVKELPFIKIDSVSTLMDDVGPSLDVGVTFENPSKVISYPLHNSNLFPAWA